jgi:hypothetical protein
VSRIAAAALIAAVLSLGAGACLLLLKSGEGKRAAPRGAGATAPPPREVLEALAALDRRVTRLEEARAAPAEERPAKPEAAAPAETPAAPALSVPPSDLARLRKEIAILRSWLLRASGLELVGRLPADVDLSLVEDLAPAASRSNPDASSYSPDQARGPPDVPLLGDNGAAWCPKDSDSGPEWLEVEFDGSIVPLAVVVRESFNPGAIAAIEAADGDGNYVVLWEGQASSSGGTLIIYLEAAPFPKSLVRVVLDTARAPGWNEIDAVGLIARDGVHWAAAAQASSTYGR